MAQILGIIRQENQAGIQKIEAPCQMGSSMMKFMYWTNMNFKFDKEKRNITLLNNKYSYSIDLNHYFARRSQRHQNSIVLEIIKEEMLSQINKFTLAFSEKHLFENVYK